MKLLHFYLQPLILAQGGMTELGTISFVYESATNPAESHSINVTPLT